MIAQGDDVLRPLNLSRILTSAILGVEVAQALRTQRLNRTTAARIRIRSLKRRFTGSQPPRYALRRHLINCLHCHQHHNAKPQENNAAPLHRHCRKPKNSQRDRQRKERRARSQVLKTPVSHPKKPESETEQQQQQQMIRAEGTASCYCCCCVQRYS